MTFDELKHSLSQERAPEGLNLPLKALWADGAGDWDAAHTFIQDDADGDGAWVHAYLHRKEGDTSNAHYWYKRASKSVFEGSLEAEWESIVKALLKKQD